MIKNDTKYRIIEAAGEIFAEKGYEAATVREICDAAEVNIASIKYHFGGKEQLYLAVFQESLPLRSKSEDEEGTISQPALYQEDEDFPPEEQLREVIRHLTEHAVGLGKECKGPADQPQRPSWRRRLFLREKLQPTPFCMAKSQIWIREEFAELLTLIERLLPQGVEEQTKVRIIFCIWAQSAFYAMGRDPIMAICQDNFDLADIFSTDAIAEFVANATLATIQKIALRASEKSLEKNKLETATR